MSGGVVIVNKWRTWNVFSWNCFRTSFSIIFNITYADVWCGKFEKDFLRLEMFKVTSSVVDLDAIVGLDSDFSNLAVP